MTKRGQSLAAISTLRDFHADRTLRARLREGVRDLALKGLSLRSRLGPRDGLQIVYYHHVFDDERAGFRRQLDWMHQRGDFVSLDRAIQWVREDTPLEGRHFCITFDDGFATCGTHALRELEAFGVEAAFFIATEYVDATSKGHPEAAQHFFNPPKAVPFMTWDDCRRLRDAGMTLGSHTVSHRNLAELSESEARSEMSHSKETLERELGVTCEHFCAPRGKPGLHYHATRDPALAHELGYHSFLTTIRGLVQPGLTSQWKVERDHLMANWPLHQLAYFLGA